jgi:hypothetical protein
MFLTAAHRSEDIEETLFATEKAFDVLRKEAKSLGPVPQLEILKAMAG